MTTVDYQVVKHLNRGWPRRATVCSMTGMQASETFDAALHDYPSRLVPFFDHPAFQRQDEATKSLVLTWGWMGYNQRTITAEDCVVNPALNFIASDLLKEEDWHFHEAIRQTLVDEHYHTLMHMRAMERTRAERDLTTRLSLPRSVTFRRLEALKATLSQEWEKSLASVAFATVAEISVNAFLDILADDERIQPANRLVAQMHNRDEYAHSKTLGEISKVLYQGLGAEQKRFFVKVLPEALRAFVAQDYSMWEAILGQLGIEGYEEMLADASAGTGSGTIMRDYSGLHRFAEETEILADMDFDFTGSIPASLAATE